MLDFGMPELFLIIAVAVLVIGPKEIPQIMYGLGKLARRAQYFKFAMSQQFDDFMQQAELDEMRKDADLRVIGDVDSEMEADEDLAQLDLPQQEKTDDEPTGS